MWDSIFFKSDSLNPVTYVFSPQLAGDRRPSPDFLLPLEVIDVITHAHAPVPLDPYRL